jgi:glycosyltransferase involved in cell wall biosynthesis
MSQNKLFDYLASGKPVLANQRMGYCIITAGDCGIARDLDGPEDYAMEIEKMAALSPERYQEMCINARRTAESFDFTRLTDKLLGVITSAKSKIASSTKSTSDR